MPLSGATRGSVRRIRCIALPPHPPGKAATPNESNAGPSCCMAAPRATDPGSPRATKRPPLVPWSPCNPRRSPQLIEVPAPLPPGRSVQGTNHVVRAQLQAGNHLDPQGDPLRLALDRDGGGHAADLLAVAHPRGQAVGAE